MASFDPDKLHTTFIDPATPTGPLQPRSYTLTHSDRTGDLFLTIAEDYDQQQISGWYTRLMRDEVLARWILERDQASLHVHCHVSGGIVLGTAKWRSSILHYHMPQVLQAFRYGDRGLFAEYPRLDQADILVHFHATQDRYNQTESFGSPQDYKVMA